VLITPETHGRETGWTNALLAPYRRITSSGAFIPEIDGFRFVAILFVFLYHLSEDITLHSSAGQVKVFAHDWAVQVAAILSVGVPLFFVVSGCVLGMPFAEMHLKHGRQVSLKKYFLRRLTRLEPPYVLALLLLLVLKLATGKGSLAQYLPHFLASVFYVHNAVYAAFSTINVVAWSLEVEVQFYIIAPLLALVFLIQRPLARRITIGLLILAATLLSQTISDNYRLSLSLLGYAQYFFAGFLLADIHVMSNGRYPSGWAWDAVSVGGWTLLLVLLTTASAAAVLWTIPWLIFVLYQAAFRGVIVRKFFVHPLITTIGGMCYTIYLLHNYLIYGIGLVSERLFQNSGYEFRLLTQFALMAPLVLLVSALYFRFVERPCMRPDWPTRAWKRIRTMRAPEAQTAASA
jgi:peptidoglycan/LPS O-acetylase OafA/YrhL